MPRFAVVFCLENEHTFRVTFAGVAFDIYSREHDVAHRGRPKYVDQQGSHSVRAVWSAGISRDDGRPGVRLFPIVVIVL